MLHRFSIVVATLFFTAALTLAQTTRIVDATGTLFIDRGTGTNVTNCYVGDTVQWIRQNGAHTVTSGTSPFLPGAGSLFNASLNSTSTTYSYVVTTIGPINYFCSPHFSFGMLGLINVLPDPLYVGSDEDLLMASSINTPPSSANPLTSGGGFDVKTAPQGSVMSIRISSPASAFNYTPLVLVGQLFTTGATPPAGALPGLHVNPSGAFLIIDGSSPGASGLLQLVQPGGSTYAFLIPVGAGLPGMSMMTQALALSPSANNGFFAAADAHEMRFVP